MCFAVSSFKSPFLLKFWDFEVSRQQKFSIPKEVRGKAHIREEKKEKIFRAFSGKRFSSADVTEDIKQAAEKIKGF